MFVMTEWAVGDPEARPQKFTASLSVEYPFIELPLIFFQAKVPAVGSS